MTSKELNEVLNKTRKTPNISLTPEQVKELINDLEVLEILKNTPFIWKEKGIINIGRYADCEVIIEEEDCRNKEDYKKIEEWLDDKS